MSMLKRSMPAMSRNWTGGRRRTAMRVILGEVVGGDELAIAGRFERRRSKDL